MYILEHYVQCNLYITTTEVGTKWPSCTGNRYTEVIFKQVLLYILILSIPSNLSTFNRFNHLISSNLQEDNQVNTYCIDQYFQLIGYCASSFQNVANGIRPIKRS